MKAKESDESRQRKIEIAAYHLAERRHFAPGHEVADWLAAEAMVAREESPPGNAPAVKPEAAQAVPPVPASAGPAVAAASPKMPKAKPAKAAKAVPEIESKPVDAVPPVSAAKTSKSKGKRPPAAT